MSLHFFDFEVYAQLWTVTIINPVEKTETVIVNDPKKLNHYYEQHKNEIFVGYNCRGYDQYIFKGILCGFDPKEINDFIIVKHRDGWQFSDLFRQIPLIIYDVMPNPPVSLKTLEGFMGSDIRETEIPFDYKGKFTPEMIQQVLKYNKHDVEQTIEVFLQRKNEFDAQLALVKEFGLPLVHIGKTQAQLAAIILGASRREFSDEWEIRLPETLQLSKYKYIADWFLDLNNHRYDANLETDVAGVPHVFGYGGLHGAKKQYNYVCGPDETLVMADVDQLYPTLMIRYGLLSRAISTINNKFEIILNTSLRLKKEKKKKQREPYKRICNITYGAQGDRYNPMYDPLHRNLVCVYGQVLLLDLIEKLEDFCEIIQSNTDGILVKIKISDYERLDDTVFEWEKRTGLHMSFDEFKAIYQKDVNNYIAVDYDGNMKTKGAYVKGLSALDYDLPIINRAMKDYIVKGIPVETTINNCNDLIEFQKIVKVSSKYAAGWYQGRILQDKCFRVFASKKPLGIIGKVKTLDSKPEKFASTPENCFIYNDSVKGLTVPDDLDKQWYVNLTNKRLKQFFGE